MIINNIRELAEDHLGIEVKHLERAIYKDTECGAWITWDDDHVCVGSIVEGSDAEFSKTFSFPFPSHEYDNWIETLEEWCDEAWHEANDFSEEV